MSIIIPDEILTTTRMTEVEMKQEIAVMLFQKEKLTLAQARGACHLCEGVFILMD